SPLQPGRAPMAPGAKHRRCHGPYGRWRRLISRLLVVSILNIFHIFNDFGLAVSWRMGVSTATGHQQLGILCPLSVAHDRLGATANCLMFLNMLKGRKRQEW